MNKLAEDPGGDRRSDLNLRTTTTRLGRRHRCTLERAKMVTMARPAQPARLGVGRLAHDENAHHREREVSFVRNGIVDPARAWAGLTGGLLVCRTLP